MDYFGYMVVFKNYNERVVFSLLISIVRVLLINLHIVLFFGPGFSALVARSPSFAQ